MERRRPEVCGRIEGDFPARVAHHAAINALKHDLYTCEAIEEPIQSDRPCVQVPRHRCSSTRRARANSLRCDGSITSSSCRRMRATRGPAYAEFRCVSDGRVAGPLEGASTLSRPGLLALAAFTRALHEAAPRQPILLATSSAIDVDVDALADAGVSELLRRPLVSTELAAALARCLRSPGALQT